MAKRRTLEAVFNDYVEAQAVVDEKRDGLRAAIRAAVDGGASEAEIARRLGTSRTTIRGMLGKRKRYPSAG